MGDVVQGARTHGGSVVGISIPAYASGDFNERVVRTLGQRKDEMIWTSSAVIVLPGGIGTLDELMHALAKKVDTLDGFKQPIVIVNSEKYWDSFIDFYRVWNASVLSATNSALFEIVQTPEAALELIDTQIR